MEGWKLGTCTWAGAVRKGRAEPGCHWQREATELHVLSLLWMQRSHKWLLQDSGALAGTFSRTRSSCPAIAKLRVNRTVAFASLFPFVYHQSDQTKPPVCLGPKSLAGQFLSAPSILGLRLDPCDSHVAHHLNNGGQKNCNNWSK